MRCSIDVPLVRNVVAACCKVNGISKKDFFAHTRKAYIVDARRMAIYFLRGYGFTWWEIADFLKCQHANAIYHYRKCIEWKDNKQFGYFFHRVAKELGVKIK